MKKSAYHLKARGKASTGVLPAIKANNAVTANFTVEVTPPAP